ncbi:hypothetical protein JGU71_20755 [Antrihabitans sp. YC3-6]|uniref:Uncharacterized protein n=1 Tax=Antrihabitans stalagmiti TaxID=2799499 RepID=A0A934NTN9_9NOCA|nr:hypothetical protein [Antrihabitans stalagmiti]MBJ8341319.1 hypothetical protein [Antrihabitans stalagmiti]
MKPTVWTTVYVLAMLTVAFVGIALTAAGSGFGDWAGIGAVAALTTAGTAIALAIVATRGHGGNMPRHS